MDLGGSAVSAYVLLAERLMEGEAGGEGYNFSHGQPLRVLELVDVITRLMGRADLTPVVLNEATNEIPDQFLDASKAAADLGWTPRYRLEDGLQETVAWYEEFFKAQHDARTLDQ